MLITEYLKVDHARIRRLLARLDDVLQFDHDAAMRAAAHALPELLARLATHERIETRLLVPALKDAARTRLFPDFEYEHRAIHKDLGDLKVCLDKGYPLATLAAAARKASAELRKHLSEEEEALFPAAEAILPRPASEELAEKAIQLEMGELERELRIGR